MILIIIQLHFKQASTIILTLVSVLSFSCSTDGDLVPIDLCENVVCLNEGECLNGLCDCPDGYTGSNCEIAPTGTLSLQTEFGSVNTLSVETNGVFAIWWDPKFDHTNDLPTIFNWLNEIRTDCIDNLGMADPPNPPAGYYYNVYIHHGADDLLPSGWGNGQGTDKYGMPFLTLPVGAHLEYGNVLHEGFHIFQYSANSPGFNYSGDSQWYVESAAQWYAAEKEPDGLYTFIEAGAIIANPHLALWHSFSNEAPGDPIDWLFQVRQYGMHTYLYYLTKYAQVNPDIVSGGFYANTELLPQEYHFSKVGAELLRKHFADWAAHNTGGLDYLSQEQIDRALLEVELVGDAGNLHPFVFELTDTDAQGVFTPPNALRPRGWGYNVIKINNSQATNYTFTFRGESEGSEGAAAHFEARLVVMASIETKYIDVPMQTSISGEVSIILSATDSELYLVVAAVPENFTGNQTYNYEVEIIRE